MILRGCLAWEHFHIMIWENLLVCEYLGLQCFCFLPLGILLVNASES